MTLLLGFHDQQSVPAELLKPTWAVAVLSSSPSLDATLVAWSSPVPFA